MLEIGLDLVDDGRHKSRIMTRIQSNGVLDVHVFTRRFIIHRRYFLNSSLLSDELFCSGTGMSCSD